MSSVGSDANSQVQTMPDRSWLADCKLSFVNLHCQHAIIVQATRLGLPDCVSKLHLSIYHRRKVAAGDVPSHMLFEGMSFTAHDAGDNQLDVPAGQWFVELSATLRRGAVFRSPQKLQPTVNRQSLDLPQVSFTCTKSGQYFGG